MLLDVKNDFSPPVEPYLLVGLGNPGKNYKDTRHNIGFMVVDQMASDLRPGWQKRSNRYEIILASIDNKQVFLAKPLKYMNTSGNIVIELLLECRIRLAHLLVICDDLNLPLGRMRIRGQGSDGGHNGLASIIRRLGTNEFARLRIGIGSDFDKGEMSDFVLSPFHKAEKKLLPEVLSLAGQAALTFVKENLTLAMDQFNSAVVSIE